MNGYLKQKGLAPYYYLIAELTPSDVQSVCHKLCTNFWLLESNPTTLLTHISKLPAMRGRGKARGGRAGRGGGKGGNRMYSCSVCGKQGTRKGHALPCHPNMKEKWEGQVNADVGEEEEEEVEEGCNVLQLLSCYVQS